MDDVKCSEQLKCSEKVHVKASQWFGVHHFACTPEVDSVFLKLKKWQVPTGNDAYFTVLLCHSPSFCRSGENLLIDAGSVDKGEEHAECWVTQMAFILTVQLQRNCLYLLPLLPEDKHTTT